MLSPQQYYQQQNPLLNQGPVSYMNKYQAMPQYDIQTPGGMKGGVTHEKPSHELPPPG